MGAAAQWLGMIAPFEAPADGQIALCVDVKMPGDAGRAAPSTGKRLTEKAGLQGSRGGLACCWDANRPIRWPVTGPGGWHGPAIEDADMQIVGRSAKSASGNERHRAATRAHKWRVKWV